MEFHHRVRSTLNDYVGAEAMQSRHCLIKKWYWLAKTITN